MNIHKVRKLTKPETWKWEGNFPPQRVTLRCADCRWSHRDVLLSESSRLYAAHREDKHGSP